VKYDYEFKCPDGHSFNANAKVRARCPDCGKIGRRTYAPKLAETEITSSLPAGEGGSSSTAELEPPKPVVKLLRRGKPKANTVMAVKKTTPPKGKDGKFLPRKKTGKTYTAAKKSTSALGTNKLVKKTVVPKGKNAMPKVKRPPNRTAIARHIAAPKSYTDEMIERYGKF
jgi:hypothetical protein